MSKKRAAAALDRADRQASDELNGKRGAWWMRLIGTASDIGDQPQMRLLCAAVVSAGVLRRDKRLAVTGVRMLAAHTIATWGKSGIKAVVDRTRPSDAHDGYKFGPGSSDAHGDNSFPSGHSAGVLAMAQAFVRGYPEHAAAARIAAGAVAGVQVARGEHFIGDVLAGSAIGVIAEQLTAGLSLTGKSAVGRAE